MTKEGSLLLSLCCKNTSHGIHKLSFKSIPSNISNISIEQYGWMHHCSRYIGEMQGTSILLHYRLHLLNKFKDCGSTLMCCDVTINLKHGTLFSCLSRLNHHSPIHGETDAE